MVNTQTNKHRTVTFALQPLIAHPPLLRMPSCICISCATPLSTYTPLKSRTATSNVRTFFCLLLKALRPVLRWGGLTLTKSCHKKWNINECELHNWSTSHTTQLIDFGLARHTPQSSVMHTRCGTKPYAAPEVLKTGSYSRNADLWSFGVMVYEWWVESSLLTLLLLF